MKFFAVFIAGILILNSSLAQHPVLFGTTHTGNGAIFRYDSKGKVIKSVYRFKNSGVFDRANMIHAENGLIYGVASGGPFGCGIIYSLDPTTSEYKIEKAFKEVEGREPTSLVEGKDGKFYGTTPVGGLNGYGTLFSFDPATSNFKIVVNFYKKDLFAPGSVTLASNGLLYGKAFSEERKTLLFSYNTVSNEFRREISMPQDFTGDDIDPLNQVEQAMIEGEGGILYGLTEIGGVYKSGCLFSFTLASKQLTRLFDFNSESGISPNGALTLGSDGKLYSTTASGGKNSHGTIFCFDPKRNSMNVIYAFNGFDGSGSRGGLCEGEDGNLYGMTSKKYSVSSSGFSGSIFYSIDKSGINYKVLRNFDHPGRNVGRGNIITVDHKMYGTAFAEASDAYPYIFSYDGKKDLFQKMFRTNQEKGYEPIGSMLQAGDGRLYGLAYRGGGLGLGGIFSFNPGTEQYTMLLSFNGPRGYIPLNELVLTDNGKLYGLTTQGGVSNYGVIFSFDPGKSRYVVEKNFYGYRPVTGFCSGNDGILYSTIERPVTIDGQLQNEYLLFSFNPTTGKFKELSKLCCGRPGIFTQSSNGQLYAIGENGIYSYDPAINRLNHFANSDLASAQVSPITDRLVEASDHKLYGMSPYGGPYSSGFIYSFDPLDQSFDIVYYFKYPGGTGPLGNLRYASDGKFYGTTTGGGRAGIGTLFSFEPSTKSFTSLKDFNLVTGGDPESGQLLELNTSIPPIVSITDQKKFEGETADLTVSLNRISMEAVTLNYQTVPGTANDGAKNPDFTPASGQVVIPPGEISTTISVSLLEDELVENRETFTVVLQKANEALIQLGDSIGVINIKNGTAPITPPGGEIITIAPVLSDVNEKVGTDELLIRASPNPSSSFFTLHIGGNKSDRVSVTVTNLWGQVMDKFDGALKSSQLTFGQNYRSGSYFARIVDGSKTKVIKLVKITK